jgi:multiple sugar transport system permease protein
MPKKKKQDAVIGQEEVTEAVPEETTESPAQEIAAQEAVQEAAVDEETIKKVAIENIKKKKSIGHEERTNRTGYIFIAPFLIIFLVFNFWPTLNTFIVSFTDVKGHNNKYIFKNAQCPRCLGSGKIVSYLLDAGGNRVKDEAFNDIIMLDADGNEMVEICSECNGTGKITPAAYNYGRLIKDQNFWGALGNTLIIWTFNFIPQLGFALILAIWLSDTRLNLAGKGLFRAVIYLPNLLMAASVALLVRNLFGALGHIQSPAHQFLRAIGINWTQTYMTDGGVTITEAFNFFRSIAFSRGLVAFIQWWMWYGHTLIMLMAGITSISVSLYESAVVDGANSRQTAWYITLPLLRPMMLYILITSVIGGMQMFEIPFLLTDMRGGPAYKIRTTALYQYNTAFQGANDRAYGAAISVGIFVVTIALALLIFFFLQDRSELKKKKGGA